MNNDLPIVDVAVLEQLRDAIGEKVNDIINLYLEDMPKTLHEMQEAVNGSDFTTIMRLSHSLKSSSANLGAMQTSAIAKGLEEQLRSGQQDVKILTEQIQLLSQQHDQVQTILENLLVK